MENDNSANISILDNCGNFRYNIFRNEVTSMTKILRISSALLYALSLSFLALYICLDITTVTRAHVRLIILGAFCVLGYTASRLFSKTLKSDDAKKTMKITFSVFFATYVYLLISLVLFDKYFGRIGISAFVDVTRDNFTAYFNTSVNIIPFKTVLDFISGVFSGTVSVRAFVINIVGNLVAFAPFAFFLPLLFEKMRKFKSFLFSMICIVSTVEILQLLLLTGACDIDDLILNTLGAYGLFFVLKIKKIRFFIKILTNF